MADTYVVDVDLERLRQHRSRVEQRQLTPDEVRNWLVQYGFYPRMDGLYLAEDEVLRHLDPSEVLAVRRVGNLLH